MIDILNARILRNLRNIRNAQLAADTAQADATANAAAIVTADAKADSAASDASSAQTDATQALTDASTAQAAADAAQSGVDAITVFKGLGTLTSSVANTEVALEWSESFNTSTITHSRDAITINDDGVYVFLVTAATTNNNRAELIITTSINNVDQPEEKASDYVSRDSDQNTGGVTLATALDLSDGDVVRFQAFSDADGTSALTTNGTLLVVIRLS